MAAIFNDWRHGLYWTSTVYINVVADGQMILGINDM